MVDTSAQVASLGQPGPMTGQDRDLGALRSGRLGVWGRDEGAWLRGLQLSERPPFAAVTSSLRALPRLCHSHLVSPPLKASFLSNLFSVLQSSPISTRHPLIAQFLACFCFIDPCSHCQSGFPGGRELQGPCGGQLFPHRRGGQKHRRNRVGACRGEALLEWTAECQGQEDRWAWTGSQTCQARRQ